MSAGEAQGIIQDSAQLEVEKRMDVIRNAVGRAIDTSRQLTTAAGPSTFRAPQQHVSLPIDFPGFLNCPPVSQAPTLVPRCQSIQHLTPYYPSEASTPADYQPNSWNEAIEHTHDDEDMDYMPNSLEECMMDA